MKRTYIQGVLFVAVFFLFAFLPRQTWAEDAGLTYSISFTDQELDDLLAPIALYPDPLLAQMLPASTYPNEVADAAMWLNSGGDISNIDEQSWEESVRAIAQYPSILQMMAENIDWTANLGDAFLNQPEDVANAIQRLRWRARAVGNLVSNADQSVIIEGDYIQIVPAQPQYMYVPQYNASVVYAYEPTPGAPPFVTFGFGLMIGGWLSMDFDWSQHHVIYHGWDRTGWVDHARPYVHVRNVYVDRSRPFIDRTWRHDSSHGDPSRYLASRPSGPKTDRFTDTGEIRGRAPTQSRPVGGMFGPRGDVNALSNRGSESRGIVVQQPAPLNAGVRPRPAIPTPTIGERPPIPLSGSPEQRVVPTPHAPVPVIPRVTGSPSSQPATVSESPQPSRTPSVTYGGYRGANEAREQSLRGQASRQSTEVPRPSRQPETHGGASQGGNVSRDRQR